MSIQKLDEFTKNVVQRNAQLAESEEIEIKHQKISQHIQDLNAELNTVKRKKSMLQEEHERICSVIKKIEGSHAYTVKKRRASRGELKDGVEMRKHKVEVEKLLNLNEKLVKIKRDESAIEDDLARIDRDKLSLDKEFEAYSLLKVRINIK